MRHAIGLSLILFAVWLLWSGHYTPLLISLGALSAAGVVVLIHRMGILDREGQPLHLVLRILAYLPWLMKEVVMANLAVARVILSPRMPIRPRLLRIRALQESEVCRVILANSITLTPGTISLRIRDNEVLVHALTEEAADNLEQGEMNRRVRSLEGDPS